jgi:DNA mismatch repair ATPase MutS
LGCSVPGREARLFIWDKLFTLFEKEENIKDLRSKLEDDLVRIFNVLNQATSNSIIIINKILTSTTMQDAIVLSKKIAERIAQSDSLCVWVTPIGELGSFNEKTVSMTSTVVPENPALRTYKILRKPSEALSYAISIARKYQHI